MVCRMCATRMALCNTCGSGVENLVWSLTAPLGALGVMALFVLGRSWDIPWLTAAFASMTFALASPWWAASGVLYHDSLAVALILLGLVIWQCRPTGDGLGASLCAMGAGFLFAFAVVTTYLVLPIVLLICLALVVSRPSRRSLVYFFLAFLPTLSVLPISNAMVFGSPFATGYSAGGFDQNFPSPLNLANAWEKIGFYLWHSEYGLLWSFPVFFFGAIGLILGGPLQPRPGNCFCYWRQSITCSLPPWSIMGRWVGAWAVSSCRYIRFSRWACRHSFSSRVGRESSPRASLLRAVLQRHICGGGGKLRYPGRYGAERMDTQAARHGRLRGFSTTALLVGAGRRNSRRNGLPAVFPR